MLALIVAGTVDETSLIRRVELTAAEGGVLPGFDPGAHITLHVPGVGRRKYSLVNAVADAVATAAPQRYTIGVRREESGDGGSKWVHGLKPGDRLEAEPPENDFALVPGSAPVLLVAGGIGVTPLVSKAAFLKATGRPFRMVYAARSQSEFAFLDDLRALCGGKLTLHADDASGGFLDMPKLLAGVAADEVVHICGPKPMLKAAIQESRRLGWEAGRLRFELFFSAGPETPAPVPVKTDGTFEVEVKSSGAVYVVPPDKSILDVLIEAGLDPLHDCRKGECGVCAVDVVSGVPDHRDSILSDSEKAAGKIMQICISRSKSPRLVLDL